MRVAGEFVIHGLVFAALGYFSGWLVGASNSPVVSAVLPIASAVAGGVGLGLVQQAATSARIRAAVNSNEPNLEAKVRSIIQDAPVALWSAPAAWALGVLLFVVVGLIGVRHGTLVRVPEYPPLQTLLGQDMKTQTHPTYGEMAILHGLLLNLQSQGVPELDARAIFDDVIIPFLQDPKNQPGGELADVRTLSLQNIASTVIPTRRVNRGPASDAPPSLSPSR